MFAVTKKFCLVLILIVMGMLASAGCTEPGTVASDAGGEKVQVYTSFATLQELVKVVGGDRVIARSLVPDNAEAHHWEPSPRDLANLSSADLFIYNGFGMEPWLDKIKGSVNGPEFVWAGEGVAAENSTDPHIWLDPQMVKQMVRQVADALAAVDSERAQVYRSNTAVLIKRLEQLDKDFATLLSSGTKSYLVVSHGAFAHLIGRYDIEQVSILGTNADEMPNPGRMAELVEFIRREGVSTVYYAAGESAKVAQTLAGEVGADVLALDAIEKAGHGDYFQRMRFNLKQLRQGLASAKKSSNND